MNAPHGLSADADTLNLMKFGIGQPVPRQEDPTLLRGEGRYTDDMNLANQAYCVMVRSQLAHGVIKGIDTADAKTMPGPPRAFMAKDRLRAVRLLTPPNFAPRKTPATLTAQANARKTRKKPGSNLRTKSRLIPTNAK